MVRHRITFRGRVQGVGFRATAAAIASKHAVSGWVRNEPDGSVLLEVQGEASQVGAFLDALRRRMGELIRSESEEAAAVSPDERGFIVARG